MINAAVEATKPTATGFGTADQASLDTLTAIGALATTDPFEAARQLAPVQADLVGPLRIDLNARLEAFAHLLAAEAAQAANPPVPPDPRIQSFFDLARASAAAAAGDASPSTALKSLRKGLQHLAQAAATRLKHLIGVTRAALTADTPAATKGSIFDTISTSLAAAAAKIGPEPSAAMHEIDVLASDYRSRRRRWRAGCEHERPHGGC